MSNSPPHFRVLYKTTPRMITDEFTTRFVDHRSNHCTLLPHTSTPSRRSSGFRRGSGFPEKFTPNPIDIAEGLEEIEQRRDCRNPILNMLPHIPLKGFTWAHPPSPPFGFQLQADNSITILMVRPKLPECSPKQGLGPVQFSESKIVSQQNQHGFDLPLSHFADRRDSSPRYRIPGTSTKANFKMWAPLPDRLPPWVHCSTLMNP
jgi:hypothetical protein